MILLDANVLLNAHNASSPHHKPVREWLEAAMSKGEQIGLAWVTILAFLRISTNPSAYRTPFSIAEACDVIDSYLRRSNVIIAQETAEHWAILRELSCEAQANRNLIMDTHLAALSLEFGATICSSDRDFSRFQGVKVLDPLRKM